MAFVHLKKRLSRRTMLRGLAGTAVSLPLLECMMPSQTVKAADRVQRYLLTSAGFSLNVDSAPGAQALVPNASGPGYDVKEMLSPILSYPSASGASLRDEITVVSNMEIPHATGPGGPAGAREVGDSFHFHMNPMFCGERQVGELDCTVTGTSTDLLVADAIGGDTLFPNLNYRVQARYYTTGGGPTTREFHRDTLSFRNEGGAVSTAIPPEVSPRQAYDTLFTTFTPEDPVAAAQREAELVRRRSILDYVGGRLDRLKPRLSSWDRQRLERHCDEIRALENLLATDMSMTSTMNPECRMLPDPGMDPALGGEFSEPFGWNTSDGYSGEDQRADLMNRMMHMALVCDLTRVGTLMYTMFQSFMNTYPLIGASKNVHALNHGGTQATHTNMVKWHIDKFAQLIAMLRDTPEGDGTLLDCCAVALMIEGGFRSGTTRVPGGHSHTTENMACLVAGGAGGLRRGEHIVTSKAHPAQVLLTLMEAVGVSRPALGEISGTIPELFA